MAIGRTIIGTDNQEVLNGTGFDDIIFARGGEDIVSGLAGNDRLMGEADADIMFGGTGNDRVIGGTGNDNVWGDDGADVLFGDSGRQTAKRSDLGIDRLDGGRGNDTLYTGDGDDFLTGGAGADRFYFKYQDPQSGGGRAATTLTDFNAGQDKLQFDVAGVGSDVTGANFVNGGGPNGGPAASFFKGAAANYNGQSVAVLTGQGFATGIDAVVAAEGEARGDLLLYFNSSVGVASLLFVDAPDDAHSIARFSNIDSLADLRAAPFDAGDFLFV